MSYTTRSTIYFDSPGPANTADAVACAVARAEEAGCSTIVLASSTGSTALAFLPLVQKAGLRLVVVTHVYGFKMPGVWEFSAEAAATLKGAEATVVTGTHVLSGLERSFARSAKVGGGSRTEAVAEALRRTVAVGLKVAVECVLIAADQGAISIEDEVVAVGGTGSGADTVCVIRPSHTASFFDLQVREIAAMPRVR